MQSTGCVFMLSYCKAQNNAFSTFDIDHLTRLLHKNRFRHANMCARKAFVDYSCYSCIRSSPVIKRFARMDTPLWKQIWVHCAWVSKALKLYLFM